MSPSMLSTTDSNTLQRLAALHHPDMHLRLRALALTISDIEKAPALLLRLVPPTYHCVRPLTRLSRLSVGC